jgi:sugar (pentulose or hexulose) kinase
MRAQVYGMFGTLALGMRVLGHEGVVLERLAAHGGVFRTEGVVDRLLAGALDVPVSVSKTAGEGGAWGAALLAAFASAGGTSTLAAFLDERVFAGLGHHTVHPDPDDVAGFAAYLDGYRAGLDVERAAVAALPPASSSPSERTPA